MNALLKFFLKENVCLHSFALLNSNEGYCPDCGAYLRKYFYVIRCKHCDIKRLGSLKYGEIEPKTKFCQNCGGSEIYIEKLEKINFFDIKYAILTKEEVKKPEVNEEFSQIWVEDEDALKYIPHKKFAP